MPACFVRLRTINTIQKDLKMQAKPVVLCILDGWGLTATVTGNAPLLAKTPTIDRIMQICPTARLITHGPDVGLPKGQM